MTQSEFAARLAKQADLTSVNAEKLLNAFGSLVLEKTKNKEPLSVNRLGTFRRRFQKSRSVPNLKKPGSKLILFDREVPSLHFSETFRELFKQALLSAPTPEAKAEPAKAPSRESQPVPIRIETTKSFPKPLPLFKQTIHTPNSNPTAHLVDAIIHRAVNAGVRFIHFNPSKEGIEVFFRTGHELQKAATLSPDLSPSPADFFKALAKLDLESSLPQTGRFRMSVDGQECDFIVSTLPTLEAEKAVVRVLPHSLDLLSLKQLGLSSEHQTIVDQVLQRNNGVFIVSSPRRAGQTSTLYALLLAAHVHKKHSISIEDPIERPLPGVYQSQIDPEAGFSFFDGLKAAALQDADLVMVSRLESAAVASLALKSGLHQHLILGGFTAESAVETLMSLKSLTNDSLLITTGLAAIANQRIVRRACPACQKPATLSVEEELNIKKELKFLPQELKHYQKRPLEFKVGSGCKACNSTGYKGEIGLFEIFQFNEDLKDFFLHGASKTRMQEEMMFSGQTTLRQDGIMKALDGFTTLEEVWRVTS